MNGSFQSPAFGISEDRKQRPDDRSQITAVRRLKSEKLEDRCQVSFYPINLFNPVNQSTIYTRNSLDPHSFHRPMSYSMRYALCSMPFLPHSAFPLPNSSFSFPASQHQGWPSTAASQTEKQVPFSWPRPTGYTWRWCRHDAPPVRCLYPDAPGTRRVPGRNAAHGWFSNCLEY